MASHGIKDKVAIIGAGCIPFREHWDMGADDMLIDAADLAFKSAGVTKRSRSRSNSTASR
jgi:acetyl-CoA C-acetyltransferase